MRYGMNPHQAARVVGQINPLTFGNGEPSFINYLDLLNAWQLVRTADAALGTVAATSFKHVSPAGAAIAGQLDATACEAWGIGTGVSSVTNAYVRARDADPKSSYGDVIAVSRPVDLELAQLLTRVVSDGIVAPGYEPGVVELLTAKKRGSYLVAEVDPSYEQPAWESRTVFGVTLEQEVDAAPLTGSRDALLAQVTLRFTQSNSVAFVKDGATIGIGAGQQNRVDCVRLAGEKAAFWWGRRQTGTALSGVTMASDGYLPFRDNVDVAADYGVTSIVEPGGSVRSAEVAEACAEYGIDLVRTGLRLFHH